MSFKSLVKEMRDSIGNISRRGILSKRHESHRRTKSHIAPESSLVIPSSPSSSSAALLQQSRWANLPPELLVDIIQRVEASETTWPARKDVVACASVCKSWREITKEVVKTPEHCGWLTFPISLKQVYIHTTVFSSDFFCWFWCFFFQLIKQPGPREAPIQCFIKRERATATYRLYLGLTPGKVAEYSYSVLSIILFKRSS